MTTESKETIYVDIDDEITSIIEKVGASDKKIVALVLPKRATVLQSIVNMRLLKRTSDNAKKSIVLITSETTVLPLAGTVGLYVAKTLQSKPYIPAGVAEAPLANDIEDDASVEEEPEIDPETPVGELAGEEAIEVDNDEPEVVEDVVAAAAVTGKAKKSKKDKKLKIPNFDSFRKKLALAGGILLLLLVAWYVMFKVLPKATIIIKTDTTTTAVDVTFTASTTAKTLDAEAKIVPAISQELKKENTQKVPTTGEKNLGEKATGDMTLSLTDCSESQVTVPAGSVVSSGDLNFVTQESATLTRVLIGNDCRNSDFPNVSTASVGVVAQSAGGKYNLSSRNYTLPNFGNVSGNGSNMTGGTDKIVKVVAQADVDSAKTKALEQNTDAIKKELSDTLKKQGYVPVPETFANSEPVVVATPNVGDEATEVTAKVTITYSMLGAEQSGVKTLVENEAKKQIDTSKQSITEDGMSTATYQVFDRQPNGTTRMNVKTTVVAGLQLNADQVKQEVAGKRRGEVQQILNQPGIKDVEIKFSPFWVTKVPTNPSKITIIFENAGN